MSETTTPATAPETATVDAIRNRPYLMSSLIADDGCDRIEMHVRENDELATLHHTQMDEDDEGNEVETAITTYLRNDELFDMAIGIGDALAALGDRENLANLIGELAQTLAKMKR